MCVFEISARCNQATVAFLRLLVSTLSFSIMEVACCREKFFHCVSRGGLVRDAESFALFPVIRRKLRLFRKKTANKERQTTTVETARTNPGSSCNEASVRMVYEVENEETHVVAMCSQQTTTGVFNGTGLDVISPPLSV